MTHPTAYRDDYDRVLRYLRTDAEDRTIAIIAAAYCERYARALLEGQMRTISKRFGRELFEGAGPLATAFARYQLSYALELIDDDVFEESKRLANIRNKFAHHLEIENADHPAVSKFILEFQPPKPAGRCSDWEERSNSKKLRFKAIDLVVYYHNALNRLYRQK